MAVDPKGGVYVIPEWQVGDTSYYVAKLNSGGTGLAWNTPVAMLPTALAADSQGRAYVAGFISLNTWEGGIVRLNAIGSAVDYTAQIEGVPFAIAVDGTGAAFAAGLTVGVAGGFLVRLAPDGSAGFQSATSIGTSQVAVAVDPNGAAAVYGGGALQRFDSTGAMTFSKTTLAGGALALDSIGNAYVTGSIASYLYPVRNSLVQCGSALLSVYAPDGSLMQATYIPGAAGGAPFIATGPNSTVFLAALADGTFAPTQTGPFPAGQIGTSFLWHLSPSANMQPLPLACVGNAASYGTGPIAPGEIVTLMGNGLGPQQGVAPQATLESPYPIEAAGVEVTFDGTPAPLLWVQDGQINAVAPWSLTPGQNTQICASYNSVMTNCLTWGVEQTAPAVFTVDGVHAAAVNQDGTINSASNPAAVGSIVSVWATGLGPITPSQADGTLVGLPLPNNVLPVQVGAQVVGLKIDFYTPFEMEYAGPAPYLVAGASQINFQVVNYAGSIVVTVGAGTGAGVQSPGFQIYVAGQ
jgi:uncharacterized protein (TIGR03437 family)